MQYNKREIIYNTIKNKTLSQSIKILDEYKRDNLVKSYEIDMFTSEINVKYYDENGELRVVTV